MKLPRVQCPGCKRDVAVAPAAGQLTKGRLWRHDHPGLRRDANGDLVSCSRSLEIVDLPVGGRQMELDIDEPDTAPGTETGEAYALF
ncbi:hypothetical protein ACFRQM_09305 [Streptomyces sp. NPDC056831]|uniref:hypothetical protein n=1 Tax=Streptomyces sp. NPDC056831 TaxID=3345954 RepID=UPI0036B85FE5